MNKPWVGMAALVTLGVVIKVLSGLDASSSLADPVPAAMQAASDPWLSASSSPVMPLLPAPGDAASAAVSAGAQANQAIVPADVSMADARVHGDDRAPPIEPLPDNAGGPAPTAWELSDPTRYQAYEQRQQQRVYAAYMRAADGELPKWRAIMTEARDRGVSAQELAAGEEKIKKLEAMQAALLAQASSAAAGASSPH